MYCDDAGNGAGGSVSGEDHGFSVTLDPSLYFVPKGYRWGNLAATHTVRNQYSFIAVGQDASPVVLWMG